MESDRQETGTSPVAVKSPGSSGEPMPAHYDNLDEALDAAWACLAAGASDRRSPLHTPSIASVDVEGFPAVRTVVLRAFDERSRNLSFHTDIRSQKCTEIARTPRIAVLFYDPDWKIQLRLSCAAQVHHGDEIAAESWRLSQPMSRVCYAQMLAPGAELRSPDSADPSSLAGAEAFDHFAVVRAEIVTLEWLYLAASGHRRAIFDWRSDEIRMRWVVP